MSTTKKNGVHHRSGESKGRRIRSKKEVDLVLNVMSNSPSAAHYDHLEMFYKGAFANQIAWMDAYNVRDSKQESLLVGTEVDPVTGKLNVFPLAKILSKEEVGLYRAPTGKGEFLPAPCESEYEENENHALN